MNVNQQIVKEQSWKWRLAQWLEVRWWQQYLKKKDIEQYLHWKRSYWNEFLVKVGHEFHPQMGAEVLDAGCGPAGIFMVLHHQKLTAIDPLIYHYSQHIRQFDPEWYPWVDFKNQTLEQKLPLNFFDKVYCLNVINHVHSANESMKNMHDALREGGHLVVSIDVHRYKWVRDFFRLIPLDALHPHQATAKDYIKMCEKSGLTLVKRFTFQKGVIFNYDVMIFVK